MCQVKDFIHSFFPDVGPVSDLTFIGTGAENNFIDVDGGRITVEYPEVILEILGALSGIEVDPFGPPFPQANDIISTVLFPVLDRSKRQTDSQNNQMTCIARGTK